MAKPKARNTPKRASKAAARKPAPKAKTPVAKLRTGTKQEAIIAMLRQPKGATLDAICKTTDWLPHTARAFLSAALGKRLGLKLERTRTDGVSTYRIAG